ncbi:MAG: hypothetical protein GJT30_10650 [Geobacter sp.]|nr:hypothetical protein [Geobacter sp.]
MLALRDILFTKLGLHYVPRKRLRFGKVNRLIVSTCIEHISGPESIACSDDELIVVCVVRNGAYYVKSFIDYYTDIGVKHIVLLDNNSVDNTVAIARKYDNVTILKTKLPYRTYAHGFKAYLLNRFSRNTWCLCVDIDEFFDYPHSDRLSINMFLKYLNGNSCNAVMAQMLDMFSGQPLFDPPSGQKFARSDYRYYDISAIKKDMISDNIAGLKIPVHYNGVRQQVFDLDVICLSKMCLLKRDGRLDTDTFNSHFVEKGYQLADVTCLLYHYKFTDEFSEIVKNALIEQNYWQNSKEYLAYHKISTGNPGKSLKQLSNKPVELRNISELMQSGFIVTSEKYDEYSRCVVSQLDR